jgi:hypothetical protein
LNPEDGGGTLLLNNNDDYEYHNVNDIMVMVIIEDEYDGDDCNDNKTIDFLYDDNHEKLSPLRALRQSTIPAPLISVVQYLKLSLCLNY